MVSRPLWNCARASCPRRPAASPGLARTATLHLFGGLSVAEAGDVRRLSRAVAYRNWKFARVWLREALEK